MLIVSGATPENGTDTVLVTDIVESLGEAEIIFCLECRMAGGEGSRSEIIVGGEVSPSGQVYVVVKDNEGRHRDIALNDNAQSISVIVPTAIAHRAAALTFNLSDLEH